MLLIGRTLLLGISERPVAPAGKHIKRAKKIEGRRGFKSGSVNQLRANDMGHEVDWRKELGFKDALSREWIQL